MKKDKRFQDIPDPPFYGIKIMESIPIETVSRFVDKITLFKGQWQQRSKMPKYAETDLVVKKMLSPLFNSMVEHYRKFINLSISCVYGYFPCVSSENDLIIFEPVENSNTEIVRFSFPRLGYPKSRCIADYFISEQANQSDIAAFFAVTIGKSISEKAEIVLQTGNMKEYNNITGFGITLTEAAAEYLHKIIREEMKIDMLDSKTTVEILRKAYRGCRYVPGEPAFPEIRDRDKILKILDAKKIGISLENDNSFAPEYSITALVAHHRLADHF